MRETKNNSEDDRLYEQTVERTKSKKKKTCIWVNKEAKHKANVVITIDQYGEVSQKARFNSSSNNNSGHILKTHKSFNNNININARNLKEEKKQFELTTTTGNFKYSTHFYYMYIYNFQMSLTPNFLLCFSVFSTNKNQSHWFGLLIVCFFFNFVLSLSLFLVSLSLSHTQFTSLFFLCVAISFRCFVLICELSHLLSSLF